MSQKIYTDLDIKGNTTIGSIANATTDTDKFLVSDNGLVKYRTGAEMLSDLGVAPGVASNIQHQVKAGVAINKGQAVYVTSADGTNMIVGLASNTSEATSSKTMGLLASTVAINGFANVITEGLLAGLNTIGATAGDPVWLGTDGNLIYGLINKPSAPAHLVFIGIVTRVNASNGEIFVKVQNGFEFNEIHDVDLKTTTPVNGDILGFNGTLWVNKTIAAWLGYTPANASGTTNYVSKFTGTTSLGNSQIFDDGTNVGIGTTSLGAKLDVNGYIKATGFKTPSGTSTQFLMADGSSDGNPRVFSWENAYSIGFSNGEVPTNSGSQYPYIFHNAGGGYIPLATHNYVINNFIRINHPIYNITQSNINDWLSYRVYSDTRQIQPSHLSVKTLQFGFTSWDNNNSAPWGDYLHFGGYQDNSGGNQNLIIFKKNGFGLRQFQGSSQGVSSYSSFVDYWHSGNFNPNDYAAKNTPVFNNKIVIRDNSIEEIATNNTSEVAINYAGYNLGYSQYRNLVIYDGKGNNVATFNGQNKSLNLVGTLTANSIKKSGGTATQILMANGDVIEKSTISNQTLSTSIDNNGRYLSISGGNQISIDSRLLHVVDSPNRNPNDAIFYPNVTGKSVRFDFISAGHVTGTGNYAGLMTFSPWDGTTNSTGDSSYQLAFYNQTGINGSGIPGLKIRKGIDTTWNNWYKIYTDGDFSQSHINNWNTAFGWGNHASAGYALANGTTNYLPKFTAANTLGNSLIFDNGTNVGIGTNTPTATLEVSSSNYTGIAISRPIQNAGVYIQAKGYDTGNIYRVSSQITFDQVSDTFWVNGGISFATASSGSLVTRWKILTDGTFQSNGAGKIETSSSNLTLNAPFGDIYLMPQSTKNVGIGTISPSEKLDVNGNIKAIDIIDQQGISIYLKLKTVNGNVTIDNSYHNKIVRITASCTITIPAGLRTDFNCTFEVIGAYTAQFVDGSGATTSAPFGRYLKTDLTAMFYCTGTASNYRLNGSLTTS